MLNTFDLNYDNYNIKGIDKLKYSNNTIGHF